MRKSIRRTDIEDRAESLLRGLQRATQFFKLARAIFIDIREMRSSEVISARHA